MITGTLEGVGGLCLRTVSWPAESPRGRVLLVHGLGEHAGRLGLLADALAQRGYSVFAPEHRGHGESQGARGYVASFDLFVDDLARAAEQARKTLPGPGDLFLYGHSMGALILLRYLQTRRPSAPGVVLSAPWLGTAVPIPRWKELAASVLRRVAPRLVLPTSIKPEQLTADAELQQVYRDDPLVVHGISVAMYDAVLEAQEKCLAAHSLPHYPTLLLLPLGDPLVDMERTTRWAEAAGAHVEVARLPGRRHEPHNDLGREEVFRLVAGWLDSRTPEGQRG